MKTAVIFGAGNIGRGFIGQLLCQSGYQVTFFDVDETLIAALNRDGAYRLEAVFNEDKTEYRIGPVRALHSVKDKAALVEVLATADLAATAVGAHVLPHIAPVLAAGVARRAELNAPALDVLICENLKNAAATLRKLVEARLDPAALAYSQAKLGLVDTVIGRMVPAPTAEMRAQDPSLIRVEPYAELPVDRTGFRGPVPAVTGLSAHDPFAVFTARKLYLHNCGHALLAYAGALNGHEYGWQALADPVVQALLAGGLRESVDGIVASLKADRGWLEAHLTDLLRRFGNRALGDTVFRLGRDPLRKLQPADRLVGAARVAETAGAVPRHLAFGIAAAFCFAPPEDEFSVALQQRLEAEGLASVLEAVCRIKADEPLGRAIAASYAAIRRDPVAALVEATAG